MKTENKGDTTRAKMDEILRSHQSYYPDDGLIVCLSNARKNNLFSEGDKALVLGFGSGRHVKLCNDFGLDVSGIDYANEAIPTFDKMYPEISNRVNLIQGDFSNYNFEKESYKVVIAWNMFYLQIKELMTQDIKKIHNILEKNGVLILNLRTKDNWFYSKGEEIEKGRTYILGPEAAEYCGIQYTFLDDKEAVEMLESSGFKVLTLEYRELRKQNLEKKHCWWVITAQKVD